MENTNKRPTTLGGLRVDLNFNPNSDDKIGVFKQMMAAAIDFLNNEMTHGDVSKNNLSNFNPEVNRCLSIAMTNLETASMYGVKAMAKTI